MTNLDNNYSNICDKHTEYQARWNQGDIGDKSPVLFENLFSKSYKLSRCFLSL